MRLAFFSTQSGWGGSEVLWTKAALYAIDQNDSVLISVMKIDFPEEIESRFRLEASIRVRDTYNSQLSLFRKLKSIVKHKRNTETKKLLGFRPNHVVINQSGNFDILNHYYGLYKALTKNGIEYSLICHSHKQYSEIPPASIYPRGKEVFQSAKHVFFISQKQKSLTERKLCTKLSNAIITWNPANLSNLDLAAWPESSDTISFGMVGFLGGEKGHDTVFQVLSSANWKSRKWELNIYGTGYGLEYLKDLARFFSIEQKVRFHGHTNDIRSVWAHNHVLLIPSAAEGMPISLCEAMICGRIAVATDVGGHKEVIKHKTNGFLAESPDVESYARALELAWDKQSYWKEMGEKAHADILAIYDKHPERTLYRHIQIES